MKALKSLALAAVAVLLVCAVSGCTLNHGDSPFELATVLLQ